MGKILKKVMRTLSKKKDNENMAEGMDLYDRNLLSINSKGRENTHGRGGGPNGLMSTPSSP